MCFLNKKKKEQNDSRWALANMVDFGHIWKKKLEFISEVLLSGLAGWR